MNLEDKILETELRAAKRLSLCQKTLYNLRRAGKIPYVRVGSRIMYRVATLDKWAADNEQAAK